jgi:integrase
MAIDVYIEKRYLNKRKRNGQRQVRYSLRWWDEDGTFRCESTGTADMTQAAELRKLKWAELNLPCAAPAEPKPVEEKIPGPTWDDCRASLRRAMEADKLRPTYVNDSLLMLDSVRRTFPEVASPADITADMANEYKRRRAEDERRLSAWTVRGDLSTLRAIFGKWLGRECGLLDAAANPFANVKPPKCDEPDVRIVTAKETVDLFAWLGKRWNNWQLPMIYLDVAGTTGWRATEIASMKADDVLDDGFVRVAAETSKTRRHKHGWLPPMLQAELRACAADGWAFGRFSDELRRRLLLWKRQPHHAAKIKGFSPERLVGWMQDELQRYNKGKAEIAAEADPPQMWEPFTLHDFRRTAITALQMSGTTEKEASVMVGCTPEVMRRHYERMDQQGIARRAVERRIAIEGAASSREQMPQSLRALYARAENDSVDSTTNRVQTAGA